MKSPSDIGSTPVTRSDRDAEDAAKKVRRSAEIHDKTHPNETEKNEAGSKDFETHAELERKKHYRGNPPRV